MYVINKVLSNWDYYTVSNVYMILNNESEKMWKEAVVAYFKLLHWHFRGNNEENHENLSQYRPCPEWDSNRRPSE
jgi:hypothetical protein